MEGALARKAACSAVRGSARALRSTAPYASHHILLSIERPGNRLGPRGGKLSSLEEGLSGVARKRSLDRSEEQRRGHVKCSPLIRSLILAGFHHHTRGGSSNTALPGSQKRRPGSFGQGGRTPPCGGVSGRGLDHRISLTKRGGSSRVHPRDHQLVGSSAKLLSEPNYFMRCLEIMTTPWRHLNSISRVRDSTGRRANQHAKVWL